MAIKIGVALLLWNLSLISAMGQGGTLELKDTDQQQTDAAVPAEYREVRFGILTGVVTSPRNVDLPLGATLRVRLEEVSGSGAPLLLSEALLTLKKQQFPFRFRIDYFKANIVSGARYQLRADLLFKDTPLFTTKQATPVRANGSDGALTLRLEIVPGALDRIKRANASVKTIVVLIPPDPLQQTCWSLTELDGKPVIALEEHYWHSWQIQEANGKTIFKATHRGEPLPERRRLFLKFDPPDNRYYAAAGVNVISGRYSLTGGILRFEGGFRTLIGSTGPMMEQEDRFSAILDTIEGYQIRTLHTHLGSLTLRNELELLDRSGRVRARFQAEAE
jgi:uncharacterized lipoprotein YbaY/heat shock protein HslJ